MSYIELDKLKKLRQFDIRDTGCCSAFCPYVQSNYCRLYKVELVNTARCAECNGYSLEELERRLAKAIKEQNEAYSDFVYWSCQSTIDKIKSAIKEIKGTELD